jgi:thiol-disulfide isomerase/thioredoxin
MKFIQQISVIVILALLVSACSNKDSESKKGFTIYGKIKNAGNLSTLALQELTTSGLILLDTAKVASDGSFTMQGTLPEKTFCIIRFEKGDIALLVDTNANLTLEIDGNDIDNYSVQGSKENEELKQIFTLNSSFFKAGKTVEDRFSSYTPETMTPAIEEQIRFSFDSIQTLHKKAIVDLTGSLSNSFAAYFATNFLLPDAELSFLKVIDEKLYASNTSSKYASQLHNKVESMKKTDTGAMAPEIVLSDPFGKPVSLSSFKGKIVLIDFWASWCAPCRKENPANVLLYNKYKSKGFEIFGVSLDDDREAWIEAINKDKLLWMHGSDLQKWNSSLVGTYGIDAIPYTVLVDQDGKIIAKKLRGKELENKLKELFGF